jgi:hypothetical protein
MVLRYILQYLVEHPEAKDTVQGIQRWWLSSARVERGEDEVQAALDSLVAKGWITQRYTPLSRVLYGLNQDAFEDIRSFLQKKSG